MEHAVQAAEEHRQRSTAVSCDDAAAGGAGGPRPALGGGVGGGLLRPRRDAAAFAAPRTALPFPSIVVGDDDAAQAFAVEWGSRLIDGPLPIGQRGGSGRFQAMLARFTSAIVERDVRTAERLIAAIGDR